MKEIRINTKFISTLPKLNVKSMHISSDLYILANDYLIKKYIIDDEDYLKEQEQKIEVLMNKKIKHTISALAKVYIDDKFQGVVFPYIKNAVELKRIINKDLNKEDLFNIMIKLSQALEDMHKQDIIYGDISASNIIVDMHLNPYFVDMDGAIVEGIGNSNFTELLYGNKFVTDMTARKELDIFLLNILFVNLLSKQNVARMTAEEFFKVLNNLEISENLKKYFGLIINGYCEKYATKFLIEEKQKLRKK